VSGLVARPATPQDADLLRSWRNDPETRRWSRDSGPVSAERHAAWLASVLADPARHLWVVEEGGRPVSTVRHDRLVPGRYEVSITVAPGARRRGQALAALAVARERLAEVELQVEVIEAHVRSDHTASLALFQRAGYSRSGADGEGLALLEQDTGR